MGVKEQQLGFSDWERSPVRKQTRKEKFLCEMEVVLPFSPLVKVMQPFYLQGGIDAESPPMTQLKHVRSSGEKQAAEEIARRDQCKGFSPLQAPLCPASKGTGRWRAAGSSL